MIRITLAGVTALFLSGSAFAQQQAVTPPVGPDWSKVTVTTTDLGNRTYMLEGQGGNVTVAAGDDGVIMVDGQFAPMHDKLKPRSPPCRHSRSNISSTPIITATTPAATPPSPPTA